jgi:hypothetical protein
MVRQSRPSRASSALRYADDEASTICGTIVMARATVVGKCLNERVLPAMPAGASRCFADANEYR